MDDVATPVSTGQYTSPVTPERPIEGTDVPKKIPTTPPSIMSHHASPGKSLIVGIVTIIICISLGMKIGIKQTQKTTPVPMIQPTPSPIDPYQDWSTYENTKFFFTFKFPKELTTFFHETDTSVIIDSPDASGIPLVKIDQIPTYLTPTNWWYSFGLYQNPWIYNVAINPFEMPQQNQEPIKGIEVVGQRRAPGNIVVSETISIVPYRETIIALYGNKNATSTAKQSAASILETIEFTPPTATDSPTPNN